MNEGEREDTYKNVVRWAMQPMDAAARHCRDSREPQGWDGTFFRPRVAILNFANLLHYHGLSMSILVYSQL